MAPFTSSKISCDLVQSRVEEVLGGLNKNRHKIRNGGIKFPKNNL